MQEIIKIIMDGKSKDKMSSSMLKNLPGKKRNSASMGVAEKQKLKEMASDFERVQGNMKRVMAQLRDLNVDGIKMDL